MKLRFLIFSILMPLSLVAQKQIYINPMDIPMVLSASFAELRPNHFHAGLDITTAGEENIPVKSVADGYVSRIKVSPYGYGHALFITHNDGHTTVYGHLNEYAPKIEAAIQAEQYRLQSFDVDYYPEKDAIKVKRGEVVAYSGNTGGSGGPHLHFEVRDTESEVGLNPLDYLAPVSDDQAPTVYGIKAFVLEHDSQIDYHCADRYYNLNQIQGRTINAFGHIGLGINAVDYFIAGHRPCGVVEVRLYDGNKMIFRSRLDSIPFDKSRFINSFIDYGYYQDTKQYVQKSFVDPNNQLDIFGISDDLYIAPGEIHNMRYELSDHAGNTKVVSFSIAGKRSETAVPQQPVGEYIEYAKEWIIDTCGITVRIPHSTFYKNEHLVLSTYNSTRFARPVYQVGDYHIPLQNYISLTVPVPARIDSLVGIKYNPKQVFVARLGANNSLGYIGGEYKNGIVTAETRSLGHFIIATDTIAPKVTGRNKSTSLTQSGLIMIGVGDNMSGISKYNIYIDGQWKLFEYDYKNTRLIARVSKLGLTTGQHKLLAKVEDPCGNVGVWEWTFRVR